MKSRIYTIIVGDLVGSRRENTRPSVAQKIDLALDRLYKEYEIAFMAPLIQTRGIDELSGVLKQPNMSYRICRFLNDSLYPHVFRLAIVCGTLDIAINSKDASKMDGPAFHRAADMIERAKNQNLHYCFDLGPGFAQLNPLLDELANLIHIISRGWSKHQRQVMQLYKEFNNQKTVAGKLGITQQAVSDALRQAHQKEIARAEKEIDKILESRELGH